MAEAAPVEADSVQTQKISESVGKSVGFSERKEASITCDGNNSVVGASNVCATHVKLANSSEGNIRSSAQKRKQEQDDSNKKKARQQKRIKPNDREYEVEKIINYKNINNRPMYLVKWKGWASQHNTWEPYENLSGCTRLLCKFFDCSPSESNNKHTRELERLRDDLSGTIKQQDELLNEYRNKSGWLSLPKIVDREEAEMLLNSLAKMDPSHRDPEIVSRLGKELKLISLVDRRSKQLEALKEWEHEINVISQDSVPIKVQNNFDLEPPPPNFMYITDYIPGESVVIPDEPPCGCDCYPRCVSGCACFKITNEFGYTPSKKVRVSSGTPIYECNKYCKCGPECRNRVVQIGRKVKLCIFKTNTNCGWGVKALQNIKEGTFVTVYVGEVITSDEAEKRGKIYDKKGSTYLFDLDYNDKEQCLYTVDADVLGNVSHFINHSCDPNLKVYGVWINCLDPNLPKLAMFACKDIKSGEEITFDYTSPSQTLDNSVGISNGNGDVVNHNNSSTDNSTRPKILCQCRSDNCRQFIF